jgi:hypothetical protein
MTRFESIINDKSDRPLLVHCTRHPVSKDVAEAITQAMSFSVLLLHIYRVRFSPFLYPDSFVLHVDHLNGGSFPVGTLCTCSSTWE